MKFYQKYLIEFTKFYLQQCNCIYKDKRKEIWAQGGRSMNKYNHSCISVALDFDKRNWILLDFSSVHNAKASCESLNDITSYTVFAIDYEEDFVNTVNRISPNELHYNKNFIDYIRLHHKLSTSEIETIYSKLIQAKVKQEVRV